MNAHSDLERIAAPLIELNHVMLISMLLGMEYYIQSLKVFIEN